MIKYFDINDSCRIVIEPPLIDDDIYSLERLLQKEYLSWDIEFGRIYSIDIDIVEVLYMEIFVKRKDITLITHKSKLNRYLHSLGFHVRFESLIKQDIIKSSDIEVVLLGGSADSSSKVIEIVKKSTFDNLTFIVVQHVEPNKTGIFDNILQKLTKYKVSYAQDGEKILKSHIYLAPNNKHLNVIDGFFSLGDEDKYNYAKPSISISYESFSSFYKEKLLVIQECGYASDGVDKIELLKSNNSKLIIQDINECSAKPMVQNALNVHLHDYVLTLKEIVMYINIVNNKMTREAWLEYLLDRIYEKHNYDFRMYHKDMLNRRIDIFMLKHDIYDIRDAVIAILYNNSAFKAFFLEVSINVTELFRNPDSYKKIIETLNQNYKHTHNIKLWSAGCSSGEEVYSIGIVLDLLGLLEKSIIYATDFNSVILEGAKNGAYSKDTYEVAKDNFSKLGLNSNLNAYFKENQSYVVIDEKIKDKALFFQHNLIEDSSFNEFDIIICKNVIIYFDYDLQKKVFQLFYDSLKFGGYLVLGMSEMMIPDFSHNFQELGKSSKIFKKVA